MELRICSTDKITHIDGVLCRVWEGITADGTGCTVFVHRLAVLDTADTTRFDAELQEQLPPGRFLDLREVL